MCFRFDELILVHDEVLPEERHVYCFTDGHQVVERALEVQRFGQYRDRRRAVVRIADSTDCDSIRFKIQDWNPSSLIAEYELVEGQYSFEFPAEGTEPRLRIMRWDEDASGVQNIYVDRVALFEVRDTSITDTFDMATGDGYRYAFNGKEQDPEWQGVGNMYDYGFRIYNPRIAKFLSVDPLFKSFPFYTPYQFSANTPIAAIDLDGLESKIVISSQTISSKIIE